MGGSLPARSARLARWCTLLLWRFVLLLQLVLGSGCLAGWPPRLSAPWTRYAVMAFLVLTAIKMVGVYVFIPSIVAHRSYSEYLAKVLAVEIIIKAATTTVVQVREGAGSTCQRPSCFALGTVPVFCLDCSPTEEMYVDGKM